MSFFMKIHSLSIGAPIFCVPIEELVDELFKDQNWHFVYKKFRGRSLFHLLGLIHYQIELIDMWCLTGGGFPKNNQRRRL